jgi:hypothetical protein
VFMYMQSTTTIKRIRGGVKCKMYLNVLYTLVAADVFESLVIMQSWNTVLYHIVAMSLAQLHSYLYS